MKIYKSIGIMSGSSLDGIDLAYCVFGKNDNGWKYEVLNATCVDYREQWSHKLAHIDKLSALELVQLDIDLGQLIAKEVLFVLEANQLEKPDFICSHGHTAFHNPMKGYSSQIGNGAVINSLVNVPVVCDLRMQDVALGGQGAPIVPVGEHYLYPDCKVFLNIGGIANISIHQTNTILAYDVCPANTLLNYFAKKLEKPFDESGDFARKGTCNNSLLQELENTGFSLSKAPKSLSSEYIWENYQPILDKYKISYFDFLATIVEHIALQVSKQLLDLPPQKIMITGGGALNTFLIERIQYYLKNWNVDVPNYETVFFKEAIVMAFLGLLRIEKIENVYSSITGAQRNTISGALYQ